LELNRLDILQASIASGKSPLEHLDLSGHGEMNLRLASHLAQHWETVRRAFGSTFWDLATGWIPDEFLEQMAASTLDKDLIEAIVLRMQKNRGGAQDTRTLTRIVVKRMKGTEQLRKICLDLVVGFAASDWFAAGSGFLAAESRVRQHPPSDISRRGFACRS
jgi:hypothetical protein